MVISRKIRAVVTLALIATLALPHTAYSAEMSQINGIKIVKTIKKVQLTESGVVKGVIVDQAGKPVQGAPVVIGQQGKVISTVKTKADGTYEIAGLKPGVHQLASFAGVQAFDVVQQPTDDSVKGIVQVIDDEGIARGQSSSWMQILMAILQNPIVWGLIITGAIAIPLALDDDAS